jgi:hypothetical protein
MTNTDQSPIATAERMVAIRGLADAKDRCARYIAGTIRSEQGRDYWLQVMAAISAQEPSQ